jgi:hypothetical protein
MAKSTSKDINVKLHTEVRKPVSEPATFSRKEQQYLKKVDAGSEYQGVTTG